MAIRRAVALYEPAGAVPYREAWAWQRALQRRAIDASRAGGAACDALILLEHRPVYTLGRASTEANLLFRPDRPPSGTEVVRVERGGEVTYHCPGQLVGYPVMDLSRPPLRRDLHWYLRAVEGVVLRVLGRYGLASRASRDGEHTGVWVDGSKVAAVGVSVSRWVTMHGFALNVSAELANFGRIVPCGIRDRSVCGLDSFVDEPPTMAEARAEAALQFEAEFGVRLERRPVDELRELVANNTSLSS